MFSQKQERPAETWIWLLRGTITFEHETKGLVALIYVIILYLFTLKVSVVNMFQVIWQEDEVV